MKQIRLTMRSSTTTWMGNWMTTSLAPPLGKMPKAGLSPRGLLRRVLIFEVSAALAVYSLDDPAVRPRTASVKYNAAHVRSWLPERPRASIASDIMDLNIKI